MTKLQKILFGIFLLLLGTLVYLEATKPQPVNWFPSYTKTDKIPLGTFVLHDLLTENSNLEVIEEQSPPFEVLKDSTVSGTYVFINNDLNFDKIEVEKLLNWVAKGNTVFASANYHSQFLKDTLQLETQAAWLPNTIGSEPLMNLINPKLKSEKPFRIERNLSVRYFEKIDTLSQIALGVSQIYNDTLSIAIPNLNFIKAPVGKGAFYLHLQPEIFSNYFLLAENNADFTKKVLSYINDDKMLIWDNYYKSGKPINVSPLHILLNNKYLKWAYYFVLIGALLFILFEGKRKQRSIPVVPPLTNKTYEYTRTIAGMYLDKNENHEIAKKQIALFMEFIRTRMRIQTDKLDKRFFESVGSRSGNTEEATVALFNFIQKVQSQQHTEKEELIKLYHLITDYKKKIDGKS
ncbi:DUF4350 domain-containing protein [Ulvibacter antarcticus]|uniref:Uncharacterized protein DUF4350 n=1 Tax=Ulvibacter antarcticus TaxID=442714 RepID=A0A3L9Z050_9FLAO|nr:DUF4350 domain-containing protein [Ulvibacter antarcticus]RMA64739.1 uncharacterized protein DUF4350 [Ulvibacter antarcticus]